MQVLALEKQAILALRNDELVQALKGYVADAGANAPASLSSLVEHLNSGEVNLAIRDVRERIRALDIEDAQRLFQHILSGHEKRISLQQKQKVTINDGKLANVSDRHERAFIRLKQLRDVEVDSARFGKAIDALNHVLTWSDAPIRFRKIDGKSCTLESPTAEPLDDEVKKRLNSHFAWMMPISRHILITRYIGQRQIPRKLLLIEFDRQISLLRTKKHEKIDPNKVLAMFDFYVRGLETILQSPSKELGLRTSISPYSLRPRPGAQTGQSATMPVRKGQSEEMDGSDGEDLAEEIRRKEAGKKEKALQKLQAIAEVTHVPEPQTSKTASAVKAFLSSRRGK